MSKPTQDKHVEIPTDLIRELLTPSELRMIKQRYLIANFLKDGLTIRAIASRVGVGTDTVVRVSRMVGSSLKLWKTPKEARTKRSSKWVFGEVSSEE